MKFLLCRKNRKREHGAAIVESLLSMFVIFLVLFGLLQVFYFVIGQYFIDYAAIRGARSRAVGFRDYLIGREVRVNALPASGDIVSPTLDENSTADRMTRERSYINSYVGGNRWLEYEFWYGNLSEKKKEENKKEKRWEVKTKLTHTAAVSMDMTDLYTKFTDYALPDIYLKHLFFGKGNGIDLEGKASLIDYSSNYIENNSGGN